MADKKITSGKLLGIDIGCSSVKLAEITADADGMVVTALGEVPMPQDVILNDEIANPRELASVIKKLCKDCNTNCKKAVFAITAKSNILVRVLDVPRSDNSKQVKLSVKYEVERLFPHSSYDTEFDFVPVPARKKDPNNEPVFVVAAYRKLVEDLLKVSKMAGLSLDAIEVGELAMGRSLIDPVVAESEPICAILDLGANKSSISVYDGTTIKNPGMDLSTTGNTFTRVISDVMGNSSFEAEELKKDYAMVNMDLIREYFNKKYASDFDFDTSSFDTAFDDPDYNPAYAEQQDNNPFASAEENPFASAEENPFASAEDNPFASSEENLFENTSADAVENSEENDVSETSEDISAEHNENVQFSENFDIKEENEKLSEEIAEKSGKKFKLDDLEGETDTEGAKEQVKEKIIDQEKSDDICKMLFDQLDNLQNEIRSVLEEYYNTTGVNVQKLIITGGTSKMPGLDDFLEEYLGIEVFRGNPRDILKFRMSHSNMGILDDLNSVYPIAIGLAMRDFI